MKPVLAIIALLLSFYISRCQTIEPPAGFKLIKADGVTSQLDHYVKGGYTFMMDEWTGMDPKDETKYDTDVAAFLSDNYRTSLGKNVHFDNGIYYGTTHFSGKYFFIVLDHDTVYKFSSKNNDAGFKKYCAWILNEAKKHKKQNADH